MTPQSNIAVRTGNAHLTEDQFCELLSTATGITSSAEAHLLVCEQCAEELATLRESITLFRHASSAYADNQLRSLPQMSIPVRSVLSPSLEPAYWVAAAAMLLAAFMPLQVLRQHALQPTPVVSSTTDHPVQSDEALLEDINREVSASVPTPMQSLADPSAAMGTSVQNSTQRKD